MKAKEFDINQAIYGMRKDFDAPATLLEKDMPDDPFLQFESWLKQAIEIDPHFANAMTLSTLGSDGMPDSRVVLLRNVSYGGLTFFSNYKSKKALDIKSGPKASMLFFWKELYRQVRIQGKISFLPEVESDAYFASRPFESQVGTWASRQSVVIPERETLDKSYALELLKYQDQKVPRPAHWGGYVLVPSVFEFWQGAPSRLHDRLRYKYKLASKKWMIERLMP